ncbi:endonuclease/exonuclease/phosphatase family protein [Rothia nasimurium]|uniref:endonuclease/exonuclease/phosphatase family protein n=1 Tax=Rothia nasimurium TaxID=85336 RepID=UPI001F333523|nr:endonuclease/exonuclease/phosphatase family protein [Rothia nasimurium]
MKLLTLNTHSWLEVHQISKIYELARFISQEGIDVVALQEVNQFIHSPALESPAGYLGGADRAVRADNFAHLLNRFLTDMGTPYYWGWAVAHRGFERYDEGVAVLTRNRPQSVQTLDLSPNYTYEDVPRRVALAVQLGEEAQGAWVVSTHMSWWQWEGTPLFEAEFNQLDRQIRELAQGAPVILAGDFNNAAGIEGEGYDLMASSGWQDTYLVAKERSGETTVHKAIHGWDTLTQALRIDLVLTDRLLPVLTHSVIFPDTSEEAVSDHSGLYLTFDL